MNKSELVKAIAEKTKMTIVDVEKSFNVFEEIVQEELKQGHEVRIYGFGKFSTRTYKARTMTTIFGKNKVVEIPAGVAVKFSTGKSLKAALNNK
ncbi:MAG: hypothetical protein B6I28_03705 [Fusobacteriia bacterium 4572_132]|nr:MAG: hypothetical protein B6I28_03705 [Fusobacteriia bacterium 4572_132]